MCANALQRLAVLAWFLASLSFAVPTVCMAEDDATLAAGRELFLREWIPSDPRSAGGGDGLGPVFNETSCVACHNQAGAGGAGPASKNVQVVSAFSSEQPFVSNTEPTLVGIIFALLGSRASEPQPAPAQEDQQKMVKEERERLAAVHPGFRTARSLVLHRSSTDERYAAFRNKLAGLTPFIGIGSMTGFGLESLQDPTSRNQDPKLSEDEEQVLNGLRLEAQFGGLQTLSGGAQVDGFTLLLSERNASPLFGSGKLDSIPDEVLTAAAGRKFDDYPEISGRVARLKDGRIGRFGWKGQKAKLSDFVLTACAVELGLDVPGEPQSGLPHKPEYLPPGLDLSQTQCDALIKFVAHLPAPRERRPATKTEEAYLEGGRKLFVSTGCAACHVPQLGEVAGIYSDLLLHDMGQELSDAGSYGGFAPNATEEEELNQPLPALVSLQKTAAPVDESKLIGSTRQEWRTPPLWGLRDSGPYLHDGRAATIDQAIAMHGGEGTRAARQFVKRTAAERLQLTMFLRSLVAAE